MRPVKRGVLRVLVLSCLLGTGAALCSAQELDVFLPDRFWDVGASVSEPEAHVFTGDFPYVVGYSARGASFFSGWPLAAPVLVSAGQVNQLAYFDDYSARTPVALLGGGYDLTDGWFGSWGARWDALSGGAVWSFGRQALAAIVGANWGPVDLHYRLETDASQQIGLRWRFAAPWTVYSNVNRDAGARWSFSLGAGFSWVRVTGEAAEALPWSERAAHRGSLLKAPENTLPAYERALGNPTYQAMETDVQQTGDGQFVLVHDPVLLRYTGELLLPRDLTLAEFQRRDAGRWFSPEFAGTGFPALQDLGPLSTAHPLAAWILDLKSIGSQPQDVDALKRTVTQTFSGGATVLLAADNLGLLESLRDSGRPLALQVDVARAAFLWGDLIPPLLSWELSQLAHDYGVSQLFLISSKAGRLPELATLTDHGVNLWFWNFHDVMYSTGPW